MSLKYYIIVVEHALPEPDSGPESKRHGKNMGFIYYPSELLVPFHLFFSRSSYAYSTFSNRVVKMEGWWVICTKQKPKMQKNQRQLQLRTCTIKILQLCWYFLYLFAWADLSLLFALPVYSDHIYARHIFYLVLKALVGGSIFDLSSCC